MVRKLVVGIIVALFGAASYLLGLVVGFNNGIEYQEEKTKEQLRKHLPITEIENPRIEIEMD